MDNVPNLFNLLIMLAGLVFAPNTVSRESVPVDADTKQEVVSRVSEYMAKYYVSPEIGNRMASHIQSKQLNGGYNDEMNIDEFCNRLTTDLRSQSGDKHLFVFNSPEEAREVAARQKLLPAEEIAAIDKANFEMEQKDNFGFLKLEILEGNVGYLRLDYFSDIPDATGSGIAAMRFLSNADAIIIDLRNNGGGDDSLVTLLASYFFDAGKVPLTGVYLRAEDSVKESWTLPQVPGKRLPDTDLYILTSSRTFSAAEDFSYSLKHLGRARIIGEKTKGGAHPVDVLIVKDSILTQISIGNSVNPITNSNWEGVGVLPDVEVAGDLALSTAHLLALKKLHNNSDAPEYRQELMRTMEHLRSVVRSIN